MTKLLESKPSMAARVGLVLLSLLLAMAVLPLKIGTSFAQVNSTSSAGVKINSGGNIGEASTYINGSFEITNTSPDVQKIGKVRIDLGSTVLHDMVFDPNGKAGDVVAKCFTADTDPTASGLVTPADP